MDAALLVEEESAGVGDAGCTNDTKNTQGSSHQDHSDLSQKEDREKLGHGCQEDGEVRGMEGKDHQISHEEKRPESKRMSPQGTDTQEEDMVSKQEDCGQELQEQEEMAEEKQNTSQEDESQVNSALSLHQEPEGNMNEESTEHVHTELSQKDKKLDENIIDNKKNEEKATNMEEMDLQVVKHTSEEDEEMEHESSEQYQEPEVPEVIKESKQEGLVETVMSEVEDVKSDGSAGIAMDVGSIEEKMEVADPQGKYSLKIIKQTCEELYFFCRTGIPARDIIRLIL